MWFDDVKVSMGLLERLGKGKVIERQCCAITWFGFFSIICLILRVNLKGRIILWLMNNKILKYLGIGCGGCLIFCLVILILAFKYGHYEEEKSSLPISQAQKETIIEEKKANVEQVTDTVTEVRQEPRTLMNRLWIAVDESLETREDLDIQFDEEDKIAIITLQELTYGNVDLLIRDSVSKFVKFGKEAFKNDEINRTRIIVHSELIDFYGNKVVVSILILEMEKSEFSKFNWETFRYNSAYESIKKSSTKFYIHPEFITEIKKDDFRLFSL